MKAERIVIQKHGTCSGQGHRALLTERSLLGRWVITACPLDGPIERAPLALSIIDAGLREAGLLP